MHPLKILALVGAALLMWGLLFAYASSPVQAATLTVNSLADGAPANDGQCTLREAILNANADAQSGSTDCASGSGSDAIRVGVSGTVQLSEALPNLSSDMQIVGPGADQFMVRRNTGGDYRIFVITSNGTEPVVSISGITISNGNASQTLGGGILNFGTLTVTDSTISGNSAFRGGGISNHETLTVTRSTISGNRADLGGGIYSDTGNLYNLSKRTTVTNSTISGNSSPRGGGVLNWDGLTVIEHSTMTRNTAPSSDQRGSGVASSADVNTRTEVLSTIIVAFGGTGDTRTATIATVAGRTGTSTVRITVSGGQASSTVPVTVKAGGKTRDTLGGTSGADLLLGQAGNDTLGGAGGKDVLCGAGGNDKLSGGTGSDTFDGGPGMDVATDYNAAAGDSRTNIP